MHARSLMSAAGTAVFVCALANTGAAASTLYERLGGYGAISAVVDQTIANVAADRRINKLFAHAGMHIHSRHFNALVQDLGMALSKFKVPAKEQHELVAILAPLKGDIVQH